MSTCKTSPWLTQGYLHDPANSENLWRGGYLHTNDIGTIDPEGYLLKVRFVDSLEKTSVGKLDKKVLRQKYG